MRLVLLGGTAASHYHSRRLQDGRFESHGGSQNRPLAARCCPEAQGCGRGLAPEDVSTAGLGQGEGPVGSKLSRSDDADDNGRGRSGGRGKRPERSSSGASPCLLRRKRGRLSSKKAYFKDKWQKNRLPSSFEPRFEDKSREKARAVHKKGHFCARDGEIRWAGLANDEGAGPANDGKVKADE